MKVKHALQIDQVMTGRAIPSDMYDEHLVYYSKSKDIWLNVMDMDVCHLVRAFKIAYEESQDIEGDSIRMRNFLEGVMKEYNAMKEYQRKNKK